MAAVTIYTDFGAQEKNVSHFFHCFTSICHEVIGPDAMILVIWMLSFKPAFPLSSFTFIKRLFSSSLLSAIRVCYLHAAKSLQSCPTLCDAIDSSPPGSTVPGILQVRTLKWVAISFSNAWKWKVKVKSLSCVRLFATPWTAAYQASLPWDFPGKSTGVCCHCLLHYLHIWGYWYFSWQCWFQLELHQAQHFSWCTLHIS